MPQPVRIRYYAQLREALKTDSEEVLLELPLDEKGLLERLADLHPRQRALFLASRIAIDDGYVGGGAPLRALPSAVDIISPISGG